MTSLARATRDPRIAQRATELSVRAGSLKAALDAAQLWVAVDERSVQARQALVALYLNAGQIDLARPHLQRLLAAEGENVGGGFLQLGALFAKQPDRARVLAVVRELASAHPSLREARLAVAQAAWNAGEFDLSLREAREARRLSPEWELAALFEAQVLARRSNAEAIVALEAFVKANPGAAEARINLARLYASEKRLPEARALFRSIAGESPDNLDASFAAGLLALQSGDHEEASTLLGRVLAGDPRDPDLVRYYLARAEDSRGRLPQALEHYRAVTGGEHRLAAQLGAATVLGRMGRVPEAREALARVVPASLAERVQVTLAEVQVLRDARDLKAAYDVLDAALSRTPDSPELLYEQALIAERLGRVDVLERNLRRVIEIQPGHAHAHNALGYSLADRNLRLDEALSLIDTALRLSPEDPYILDSMGWVLFRRGQPEKALEYLRRAWRGKADAEIGAHLGEVLWSLGQRDEARRIWDESLKVEAGNETLRGTMKRLLRR
jgi:tetratricopeptide (TPR) repeat protein